MLECAVEVIGIRTVHGLKLLDGFNGVVRCDGYAAYKTMVKADRNGNLGADVQLAICWSHLSRMFVKVVRIAAPAPAPIADEALVRLAQLYKIEQSLRRRSADARRTGRQHLSAPLIVALKDWLCAKLKGLSEKSDTAGAIRYALNHGEGLDSAFLKMDAIDMDTKAVERAMWPIKLAARSALFAGSDAGADYWAMFASLIETCKLTGVNAENWLSDVLTKLVNAWPLKKLDDLLPWSTAYATAPFAIAPHAQRAP